MRTPPNLNESQLAISIAQHYRLHDVEVTFVPGGQDAYAYRVSSDEGTFHLKVFRQSLSWDAVLKLPALLKRDFALKGVVAPVEIAASGQDSSTYYVVIGGYYAALFPFIDAVSMSQHPLTFDQLHEVGRLLAMLHGLTPQVLKQGMNIPREHFDMPHSERFKQVMAAVKSGVNGAGPYQNQLITLLKPLEQRLWAEHEAYERSAAAAKAEHEPLVLCHGDPTGGNILVGRGVHLIDWDNIILAPKERDLMFFEGDPNKAAALVGYGYVTLNPVVLRYYRLMWNIQEIADFGTRILDGHNQASRESDMQHSADLAELRHFLDYSGIGKR